MESINTNMNYSIDMDYNVLFSNTTFIDSTEHFLFETDWHTPFIVIYCIVLFFGFFENVAACICFFIKNKHLLGPTNIFIIVEAISDILLCAFFLPLYIHTEVVGEWIFGKTMCTIFWLFDFPFSVSSMMILAIAIHRYWLTIHPHQRQLPNIAAACLAVVIAIICIVIEIPRIINAEFIVTSIDKRGYCVETWSDRELYSQYNILTKVIFQLPFVISVLFHVYIDQVLNHSTLERIEKQQKKKANYMLLAIALIVFACRLPWNLFLIILEFDESIIFKLNVSMTFCILLIIAVGSACINPFLYAWLNNIFGLCLTRNSSEGDQSHHLPRLG